MRLIALPLLAVVICGIANAAKPILPVSYSWTIRPAPSPWFDYRVDTCHVKLKAQSTTTTNVILYYFPPPFGSSTGADGLFEVVTLPGGQIVTIDRDVPWNMRCPCLLCVSQICPNSSQHIQCGYVIRPGESLPPGWWTPFSQMAVLPTCPSRPSSIFSDGFESGGLRAWSARRK